MLIMIGVAVLMLINSNKRYRKKLKSEKEDELFQCILYAKDKKEIWSLLRRHVSENLVKVLGFASAIYLQMTDGFIHEDLKSLRKAVAVTDEEKDKLKKSDEKRHWGCAG